MSFADGSPQEASPDSAWRPKVGTWDPCESIDIRLEGLEGAARVDFVMTTYVLPRPPTAKLYLWNSATGEKRVRRHMLNQRTQKAVVVRCCKLFMKRGLMTAFRGKMWHVKDTNGDADLMIGGGTLVDAIHMAHRLDPTNQHVAWVYKNGINDTYEFHRDTPLDVLKWVRVQANMYHTGSEATVIELYDECPIIQKHWDAHRKKHSITKSTCPSKGPHRYEKQHEEFVLANHKDFFGSTPWQHFENCKSFYNAMANVLGVYDEYKNMMEQKSNFLDPRIDNQTMCRFNHDIVSLLVEKFSNAMDPVIFKKLVIEVLKFAAPILLDSEDIDSETSSNPKLEVPWIFWDAKSRIKLDWMMAPMGGSVVYDPTCKRRGQASRGSKRSACQLEAVPEDAEVRDGGAVNPQPLVDTDGHGKPNAKAKAKGKGRPKKTSGSCSASGSESHEPPLETRRICDGSRDKYFIDDMIGVIWGPVEKPPSNLILVDELSRSIKIGLMFLFTGGVQWNGTYIEKWSVLRKELRANTARVHSHLYQNHLDASLWGVAPEKVVTVVCDQLATAEQAEHPVPSASATYATKEQETLATLQTDRDTMMQLVTLINDTDLTKPCRFHPQLQNMVKTIFGWNGDVSVGQALSMMKDLIFNHIRPEFVDFGFLCREVVRQTSATPSDVSLGIFNTDINLTRFLAMRATYMFEMLGAMADFVFMKDVSMDVLVANTSAIAESDCMLDRNTWAPFWSELLRESSTTDFQVASVRNKVLAATLADGAASAVDKGNCAEAPSVEAATSAGAEAPADASETAPAQEATVTNAETKKDGDDKAAEPTKEDCIVMAKKGGDASTDAAKQAKLSTLAEIRNMFKTSIDVGAAPLTIELFTKALETYLWRTYAHSPPRKGAPAEWGTSFIEADPSESPPRLVASRATPAIQMVFLGKVTRMPSRGSLPVCQYANEQLYIDGHNYSTFSCEAFQPAWMVSTTSAKAAAAATMVVQTFQDSFTFTYTNVNKEITVDVPVTVHYLEMNPSVIKKANVELTRPPIPGAVTAMTVTEIAKRTAAANCPRNTTGENSEHKAAISDPKWKHCKHVFR
ncbi:unnamed protein product [Prorocentrum cordatum]|uniref:Uncharacterized protein n=1 Tax=Prorocentrum cordatum TaxID=2364126 RepID=A0ABN9WHD6_9DINO|nr:unnamed protein product [Polarella glacialis]